MMMKKILSAAIAFTGIALTSLPALAVTVTIDPSPEAAEGLTLSADTLFYIALAGLALVLLEAFLPAFGLIGLAGFAVFVWAAWSLHALGALSGALVALGMSIAALAVLCGVLTWKAYRRRTSTGAESLIGNTAKVVEWSDRRGRVTVQGETWQAESDTPLSLQPGDPVVVTAIDNLVLRVRAA